MITNLRRRLGLTRGRVARIRLVAERSALSFRPLDTARRGRILCYHSIGQPEYGINDVTPERFRRHIELALADGYRFVDAREIASGRLEGALAITFDDGLWSVLRTAVPILQRYGIPASCFVVTSWPDHDEPWQCERALDWNGVRSLAAEGVTVGSHSVSHPDFSLLEASAARRELVGSRQRLEDELGRAVDQFAIPFGTARTWSASLTRLAGESGYEHVYAQSEDRRPPGTVPRTFVTAVDGDRRFRAALRGAYDRWEEWS